MMKKGFWEGQKVWVAFKDPRDRGRDHEAEITKIGNRWVYLDKGYYRFDVDDMRVDGRGFTSPATIYFSKEDWEEEQELDKVYSAFRQGLGYRANEGVSEADIREAARLLRVNLPARAATGESR